MTLSTIEFPRRNNYNYKNMLRTIIPTISLLCFPFISTGQTVAEMGDTEITTSEISDILSSLGEGGEALPVNDAEAMEKFVRALVVQRFVLDKALEEKHEQKPSVAAALKRTRDAAITESYLREVSKPSAEYPTDEEISTAYSENKGALVVPKAWHLAQIFVAKADDTKQSEQRLADIQKQLKEKGADFSSIARVSSDDRSSSPSGGDLGWLQENLIQPPIRKALGGLKLNEVSNPVEMDNGWHIIKLLDSREATTPTLDQVSAQLKARLIEAKAQQNRQEYLSNLLNESPPAINGIELRKIVTKP